MPDRRDVPARLIDAAIELLTSGQPVSMPLREVAERAGLTTGAIQHHFGHKDALVLAALQRQGRQFADRLAARRGATTPPPPSVARAILIELLPLDDQRRTEAQVALTFEKLAANDAALAAAYRERYTMLHDLLTQHLPGRRLQDAELLLAAVGGIRTDMLLGRTTPDHAVELMDQLIENLTGR